ncbi:MAG: DUF5123 domain-containing protein [Prevotellaceae bacterium]|jgi:hypothetical protein|nr:DUF5123 domain-containing protein [Prevotellaceae bacterium]
MKRKLFFLIGMALGVAATSGCKDDSELFKPEPGVDTQLKAPQDFAAKIMGTTVKLAWRAQSNAVGFEVQLSADEAFTSPESYTVDDKAQYTVEALSVRTPYHARVKAIAKEVSQSSNFSEVIEFTTGDENIMKATPKELLDTAITLQWEAGAAVTHLVATPDGGEALPQYPITDGEKAMGEKTIAGLSPEVTYDVKLYNGSNLRGEGEYTTLPLMLPPLEVTLEKSAPDSLYLSWASGELLSHFVLTPAPVEGNDTLRLSAGVERVAIGGLMPATEYSLAAFYNNSARGASNFTTVTLSEVTLTQVAIAPQGATISWSPADSYVSRLVFTPATGAAVAADVAADDAAGKAVSGLQPQTAYTVSLEVLFGDQAITRGTLQVTTAEPPQPQARFVALGASIEDTLASCIAGDTIVLATGRFSVSNLNYLSGAVAVTIRGESASALTELEITGSTGMTSLPTSDYLVFKNLHIQYNGTADSYFLNAGTGATFTLGKLAFESCKVTGFVRGFVRLQGAANVISTLSIQSSIFSNVCNRTGGTSFALVESSATDATIDRLEVNNSTFDNIGANGTAKARIFRISGKLASLISINNSTFYNVDNYLVDCGSFATPITISNTILAKTGTGVDALAGAINGGGTPTVTNVYATSDWTLALADVTAYSNTATNLFTNPAAGDFTIKDADFAGKATAGDPRWREGGGEQPGEPPVSVVKEWNFSSSTFTSALSSYIGSKLIVSELPPVDGMTFVGSSSNQLTYNTITSENSADGNYTFTYRVATEGGGNTTEPRRTLKFDVTGDCKITVYHRSNSDSDARAFALHDGTSVISNPSSVINTEQIAKAEIPYTGGAKTLFLYSTSSSVNFYLVKVVY